MATTIKEILDRLRSPQARMVVLREAPSNFTRELKSLFVFLGEDAGLPNFLQLLRIYDEEGYPVGKTVLERSAGVKTVVLFRIVMKQIRDQYVSSNKTGVYHTDLYRLKRQMARRENRPQRTASFQRSRPRENNKPKHRKRPARPALMHVC